MEVSRNWRLQKARYGLIGEVCDRCGNKIFPPRDICPYCADERKLLFNETKEIWNLLAQAKLGNKELVRV